jgi:signal transduction histidine kinase
MRRLMAEPALIATGSLLAAALAGGVGVLLLAWPWRARQRWALARERALAERFRAERDEALRAQALAAEALQAAERHAAAQARWLASASHDLRQPAHALGLYLGALQAAPAARADAEIADTLERMRAALAALEALLAGALDLSRIDAGAVVPQWQTVALAPLLRRLGDEWALPAESRGLRLALHVADAQALTVTDPQLLERVLRNLLANAVKYTHGGGVLLACRLRRGGSGQRLWRIEVWDSGVGIAEADHERVFEEYEQLGPAAAVAGQGLGLAIVRRLATLLQLQVRLHSRPGRGSVFFVEGLAPAGRAPQAVALGRQAPRHRDRPLQGLRVAVLDDDAAVRDATLRLLARWGVQGFDALQPADAAAAPDALVADLRLGRDAVDDGPATVARLQRAWDAAPPVLWVSAEPAGGPLRARLPAAAEVEPKPLSPARLRAWLEALEPAGGRADASHSPP